MNDTFFTNLHIMVTSLKKLVNSQNHFIPCRMNNIYRQVTNEEEALSCSREGAFIFAPVGLLDKNVPGQINTNFI